MTDGFEENPLVEWLKEEIENAVDPCRRLGLKRVLARLRINDSSQHAWLRAAREALDGNMAALRNRVDLVDSGPLDIGPA